MRPIAVFLFALLGVLSFQGCSSEDGEKQELKTAPCPGSPQFCPAMGAGTACCVTDKCGLDNGFGCVAVTSDAGA
jgi:hypothetical protein